MKKSPFHQNNLKNILIIALCIVMSGNLFPQQINISKIDLMPNFPLPYLMRDWKKAAVGYDSLVFNQSLSGQYLPLVWMDNNSINYSGPRFGLSTVIGSNISFPNEAINCIPAVVSASLNGIDKSNQDGYNWVSMCQEWFNKKNGLMVYKNHPDDQTSDDWWYETMPNVFFYQLYSLYPNAGDFHNQFISIADQWLKAIYIMGGSTTPWNVPNMNYQGWDFANMIPSSLHDHNEPEASGAIAWILYNAFKVTGNQKYRIGAELAMEFLNGLNSNPSYELQLYYGVYLAARMNAELGTNYDVTKMLNWCFNSDNIRNWGAMTGKWGGYDVDGLIGEINSNISYGQSYPFSMNTFEMIGALVPMVRYDARYSRAIGKLVLNAANAARLFYPKYLPSANQDQPSWQWANQYDANSFIAHEAMHQNQPGNISVSPYASGDAINGGWGATTLTLYSSSHAGILGAIINTTNVPGILQLDVLKTDYFHDSAYPTYLYYNPYDSDKIVNINIGSVSYDIYDVVSKTFLINGATGTTSINIPANSAILAVIIPSGGIQSYNVDKFLINNVVIDYHSGRAVANYPPRIKSLTQASDTLILNDSTKIFCTAVDPDNDQLTYKWNSSGGTIEGSGNQIIWKAPNMQGSYIITCTVSDSTGNQISASDTIQVVKIINQIPIINGIFAKPRKINIGSTSSIKIFVTDPDYDSLNYNWKSIFGTVSGSGSSIVWTAPNTAGNYYVDCLVDDGKGGVVSDSIELEVRDFSISQIGQLVAFYPFNGNANDASGNNNNGTVSNAILTADRFGNLNSAFYFDGVTSSIQVPSDSSLNFQNSITINFWMKCSAFFNKEEYLLSQGSYNNRLKISIIQPNHNLRWTIKTTNGITDLDSETKLVQDSLYNITVLYSGSDVEVYLNGNLDAFTSWSGQLLQTNIALTFGSMLPADNNYNFIGTLDDIRIYNYALSVSDIEKLASFTTGIEKNFSATLPTQDILLQNYPNPFNPSTNISFYLKNNSRVTLTIFNSLGQKVAELLNKYLSSGNHAEIWNAENFASGIYYYELKTDTKIFYQKMILLK